MTGEPPEFIDLEAHDLAHLAGRIRAAAFAPNWKTVLAVDASIGLAGVGAGILVAILWLGWLGAILAGLGLLYVFAVARRFLQWRWLRHRVGLE